MAKPRIIAPRLAVVLDDGAEHEVQATNWDMLAYERHARKHGWPAGNHSPVEWATFLAWHALTRENLIPAVTYEQFAQSTLSVDPSAGGEGVDPTRPAPADG